MLALICMIRGIDFTSILEALWHGFLYFAVTLFFSEIQMDLFRFWRIIGSRRRCLEGPKTKFPSFVSPSPAPWLPDPERGALDFGSLGSQKVPRHVILDILLCTLFLSLLAG